MNADIVEIIDGERLVEHAHRLATRAAMLVASENVNYEAHLRREILWLRRKLAEIEARQWVRAPWTKPKS